MYYQNYDDYMHSILGYPNTYDNCNECYNSFVKHQMTNAISEKEQWYPEIYKIVYPMVKKMCQEIDSSSITEEMVENMTDKIYNNAEPEDYKTCEMRNGDVANPNSKEIKKDMRQSKQRNEYLRDLIKILILRELSNRQRPNNIPQIPPIQEPYPPYQGARPPFYNNVGITPQRPIDYNNLYYKF